MTNWLNLFTFEAAVLCLVAFSCGVIIFNKAKDNISKLCGWFCYTLLAWGVCAFFIGISQNPAVSLFWWRICYIPVSLTAVCIFHLAYIICDIRKPYLLFLVYLQALFFMGLSISQSPWLISDVRFLFSFYYKVPGKGPFYHIYFVTWLFIVAYSHYKLFLFYYLNRSTPITKSQLIYLTSSFGLGFIGGITFYLPSYHIDIYPLGNFAIAVYLPVATYAILRYRAYDMKVIFIKYHLYLLIYLSVFLAVYWIGLRTQSWQAVLIIVLFLFPLAPFLYKYIAIRIDSCFFKTSYIAHKALGSIASSAIIIQDPNSLILHIAAKINDILYPRFIGVYVFQEEKGVYQLIEKTAKGKIPLPVAIKIIDPLISSLQRFARPGFLSEISPKRGRDDIALETVLIPFIRKHELYGFLILGPRKNKSIYSLDDFEAFEVLANQVSLALENALLIKEREELQAQRHHLSKMSTLGSIASGVGHNLNNRFNTMLTLINMYNLKYSQAQNIDSLSLDELKKRQHELIQILNQIKEESQRGFDIAAVLSKAARQPINPQGFHLEEAVKIAFDLLKAEKEFQKVILIEDYQKKGPKLYASLSHIQDVFFNLGDNAYDALLEKERLIKQEKLTEPGFKPTITIKAIFSKDKATITIHDNGIGIRPEALDKIGEPFYSTKVVYKEGIGLGVWMARRHLQMNGGDLKVESIYTKGTTVTLTVPVQSAQ